MTYIQIRMVMLITFEVIMVTALVVDGVRTARKAMRRRRWTRHEVQRTANVGQPLPKGWHLCKRCGHRGTKDRWRYCFLCQQIINMEARCGAER